MLADHTQLITEQSLEAAEMGLEVAEQALRGLREGGLTMSPLDETRLDQHLRSLDTSALEQHVQALEKSTEHLGQQIEHSMREFEHHLTGGLEQQMKELDHHFREFDVKAFEHFGELGRSAGEAAEQATEKMRALIERAIKNGQASVIR